MWLLLVCLLSESTCAVVFLKVSLCKAICASVGLFTSCIAVSFSVATTFLCSATSICLCTPLCHSICKFNLLSAYIYIYISLLACNHSRHLVSAQSASPCLPLWPAISRCLYTPLSLCPSLRLSLAKTTELASLAATLRVRREWLTTCVPRLQSQQEFLSSRAALQLLTPQEQQTLEDIPYDLEAVHSQLALVEEALQLTE